MTQANVPTKNNPEVRPLEFNGVPLSGTEKKDPLRADDILPDQEIDKSRKLNIHELEGFLDEVSEVPTHTPKTFWDSLKIYDNKLYWYSYKTHVWNTSITTVSANYATGTGSETTGDTIGVSGLSFEPKYIRVTAQIQTGHSRSVGTYAAGGSLSLLYTTFDGTDINSNVDGSGTTMIEVWNDGETHHSDYNFNEITSDGFTLVMETFEEPFDYLWEAYG